MYLPDINVWLALAFAAHVHHRSARRWFDALPENCRCLFCRLTQHGFLRLANNPKAFPQIAVTQAEAWKLYDALVSNLRIEFAAEPPMLETIWRQFTQLPQFSAQCLERCLLGGVRPSRRLRSRHLRQGIRSVRESAAYDSVLNPKSGSMRLRVILEPSDEGGYTVYVPSLPGCISEGDSREEALENIREAIELCLSLRRCNRWRTRRWSRSWLSDRACRRSVR